MDQNPGAKVLLSPSELTASSSPHMMFTYWYWYWPVPKVMAIECYLGVAKYLHIAGKHDEVVSEVRFRKILWIHPNVFVGLDVHTPSTSYSNTLRRSFSFHLSCSWPYSFHQITPLVKAASADPSWRVRQTIAKSFGELTSVIPADACKSELFPCVINLLMDNETGSFRHIAYAWHRVMVTAYY